MFDEQQIEKERKNVFLRMEKKEDFQETARWVDFAMTVLVKQRRAKFINLWTCNVSELHDVR